MDLYTILQIALSAGVSGALFGYAWYYKKLNDSKDRDTTYFDFAKAAPRILWGILLSVAIAFGSQFVGVEISIVAIGPFGQFLYTIVERLWKGYALKYF